MRFSEQSLKEYFDYVFDKKYTLPYGYSSTFKGATPNREFTLYYYYEVDTIRIIFYYWCDVKRVSGYEINKSTKNKNDFYHVNFLDILYQLKAHAAIENQHYFDVEYRAYIIDDFLKETE